MKYMVHANRGGGYKCIYALCNGLFTAKELAEHVKEHFSALVRHESLPPFQKILINRILKPTQPAPRRQQCTPARTYERTPGTRLSTPRPSPRELYPNLPGLRLTTDNTPRAATRIIPLPPKSKRKPASLQELTGFGVSKEFFGALHARARNGSGSCILCGMKGLEVSDGHADIYRCPNFFWEKKKNEFKHYYTPLTKAPAGYGCYRCWMPNGIEGASHLASSCTTRDEFKDIFFTLPYLVFRIPDLRTRVLEKFPAESQEFEDLGDYTRWLMDPATDSKGTRAVINLNIVSWLALEVIRTSKAENPRPEFDIAG